MHLSLHAAGGFRQPKGPIALCAGQGLPTFFSGRIEAPIFPAFQFKLVLPTYPQRQGPQTRAEASGREFRRISSLYTDWNRTIFHRLAQNPATGAILAGSAHPQSGL